MNVGIHWRALRHLIVGWALTLSIVATGTGVVLYQQYAAEQALTETMKHWRVSQQQFVQYASYQPDLNFYFAQRKAWQNKGFTQPPQIAQWASRWAAMQQQFSLPHVEYEIQPSTSCTAAACDQRWPFKISPALNVMVTPVHLSWRVEHESAVIAWLQHLRTEYAGMLLIRDCQWHLAEDAKNIAAQCDLDMVNFTDVFPEAEPLQ